MVYMVPIYDIYIYIYDIFIPYNRQYYHRYSNNGHAAIYIMDNILHVWHIMIYYINNDNISFHM